MIRVPAKGYNHNTIGCQLANLYEKLLWRCLHRNLFVEFLVSLSPNTAHKGTMAHSAGQNNGSDSSQRRDFTAHR